ncbi:helix-turn-helix domain-containing protein, partial [Pseudomonas syringae]|uniref:helix-turn-helix domain-containing protein n=1 Tax=Pseudomonas syringae TaxID=317 RepID=UPI001F282A01
WLAVWIEPPRRLLRRTSTPLGETALACVFAGAGNFSNRFRQAVGATPGEYRLALESVRP